MFTEKYFEEMVTMLAILSQINLIIDRFHFDNDSDIKKHCSTLRKRMLAWLEVCNAKPGINDQQKLYFKEIEFNK